MVRSRTKWALLFVAVALTGACGCIIGMYIADTPSRRTVVRWEHPIVPLDGSRRLQVVIEQADWDCFPLPFVERTYRLYLGREYPYGFWGRLPFYSRDLEVEQSIAAAHVEWTADAAIFVGTAGERLAIPYSAAGEEPPSN